MKTTGNHYFSYIILSHPFQLIIWIAMDGVARIMLAIFQGYHLKIWRPSISM